MCNYTFTYLLPLPFRRSFHVILIDQYSCNVNISVSVIASWRYVTTTDDKFELLLNEKTFEITNNIILKIQVDNS